MKILHLCPEVLMLHQKFIPIGWTPRITFKDLVKIMVDYDLKMQNQHSPKEGLKILKNKGLNWIRYFKGSKNV